jgi:hypothetical protein
MADLHRQVKNICAIASSLLRQNDEAILRVGGWHVNEGNCASRRKTLDNFLRGESTIEKSGMGKRAMVAVVANPSSAPWTREEIEAAAERYGSGKK